MHELMTNTEEIKDTKKTMIGWLKEEVAKGRYGECCFDLESGDKVVDMIKDLAETEEKCWKAKYYELLTCELMSDANSNRFGYNNRRYASGRFAPAGRGHFAGYTPDLMVHEEDDGEFYAGPYGYPNDGRGENRGRNTSRRMGYPMDGDMRYGRAYNEYQDARRHYTETGDEAAKKKMHERIRESVNDTLGAFHEMYHDANPEIQKEMMGNLEELLKTFKQAQMR